VLAFRRVNGRKRQHDIRLLTNFLESVDRSDHGVDHERAEFQQEQTDEESCAAIAR
jgi:hypothetical protein